MNGRGVGILARSSQGLLSFKYSDEWLADDTLPAISLSMPVSPDAFQGDTVENYFDNLLPDSSDIRHRMRQALGAASLQPFDLLAAAGADCVGALQLLQTPDIPDARRLDARPVSDDWIAERLRDYPSRPLGNAPDEDFRISMAGAQEKTALLQHEGQWFQPRGATPTTHILKLPIGSARNGIDLHDSVENEWLCLEIASAFGLRVPDARIRDFSGVRVLLVKRFDRAWSRDGSWLIRLPQEDACQSLGVPPTRKYEADGGPGIARIMDLLLQSEQPLEDRRTFFRALVVFWFLAAIDGHAKNFSVFLRGRGRCQMTPLYDILSAHPIVARRELDAHDLKMAMAVQGANRHYRWQEIRPRHWLETARRARFSDREAKQILEDCHARAPEVIDEVASRLPAAFPDGIASSIFNGIRQTLTRF